MKGIGWIIKRLLPYKRGFLFGSLLIVLENILLLMVTGTQKYIIDDIFSGHYEHFVGLLVLFFALYVFSNLIHLFSFHVIRLSSFNLNLHLLKELLSHAARTPLNRLRNQTTDYVNYLANDVSKFNFSLSYKLPKGFSFFVNIVLLGVAIMLLNPIILVVVTSMTILYILAVKRFAKRVFNASKEVHEQRANYIRAYDEGISSTREVLIFDQMEWESKRINGLFVRYLSEVRKESRLLNLKSLVCDPIQWCTSLVVLTIGAVLVINGQMSIGSYIVIYQFSLQMTQSLKGAFDFLLDAPASFLVPIHRIGRILDLSEPRKTNSHVLKQIESIRFSKIHTKRQDDEGHILKDLCLSIPVGKTTALVGRSGSGKSSLMQLFLDADLVVSGKVLINQRPIQDYNRESLSLKISIMQQDPYIFPDTIRNNLLLGREGSDERLEHLSELMGIRDFIMSLPLRFDTEIGERGITLSGGQKQRLALVRAIMSSPEVLILDEATSAIDIETENYIIENLKSLRSGQTTIIVSHRMSVTLSADYVVVIDNGAVVEEGSVEKLTKQQGLYQQLFAAQIGKEAV